MRIIGTGSELPKKVVTNDDLSKLVDTSDKWIRERTGIVERHVITSEALEELATNAANKALEDAGIVATQLDYIICSNTINEYVVPSMASIVGGHIGAQCPAFDVNAACTGFLYSMDIAEGLLNSGKAEHILIISAEEICLRVAGNKCFAGRPMLPLLFRAMPKIKSTRYAGGFLLSLRVRLF